MKQRPVRAVGAAILALSAVAANAQYYELPVYERYSIAQMTLMSDQAVRILLGDTSAYDDNWLIPSLSLARLAPTELRVLRNAVFAMRGYRFRSPDLLEYFRRFEWYRPTISDESRVPLSEVDRENIERVVLFEDASPAAAPIPWNGHPVGVWHDTPVMPSGWSERFVFFPDGRLEFLFSQMGAPVLAIGYGGTYEVSGNQLAFSVTEVMFYDHSALAIPGQGGILNIELERPNAALLRNPIVLRFPVTPILPADYDQRRPWPTMDIGGITYFHVREDPEDRY